jgi:hypothetical protein
MAKKRITRARRRGRDEARENVKWSRNPALSKRFRPRTSKELVAYFRKRQERLEVAATTRTPAGQVIDWVPIDSQGRGVDRVAEPPPAPEYTRRAGSRSGKPVRFELEAADARRGPEGTVPILRKRLDRLPAESLQDYLSKHRHQVRDWVRASNGMDLPMPEIGAHWYAAASHSVSGGVAGVPPDLRRLAAAPLPVLHDQRLHPEGGQPRGYNRDVDGWVQYDSSIFPGAIYSPTSVIGGQQYRLWIKFQLFRSNWWFWCNDRWLGYYPASLFMGNQSVFSTLGDHADQVLFFGEIYDSTEVAGNTKTDMCSGQWPSAGWQRSGYMRNLRVQTDRVQQMDDFDGSPIVSDPARYDLESHMRSGSTWGSYMWLGGPDAG